MMEKLLDKINDHVLWGLLIGLVSPAILGAFAIYLMRNVLAFKNADLLLIGCVAVNVLWMNLFFKNHKDNLAKGVISATFLCAFAFFIYKTMQENSI